MVARDVIRLGGKPAILSRGYAAGRRNLAMGSGDGPAERNDEFYVLEANLPEVPHLQGKDRYRIGLEALARGADTIVLDDGFQHTSLARDLDFVLIDAISPFGGGRVLPAGLLREPLEALESAHLLGITRSDQIEPLRLSTLASYLRSRFRGIPQVRLRAQPMAWLALSGGLEPPEALKGRRALAFCGIGNPESFRRQVLALGISLEGMISFRDHHRYTGADLVKIARHAAEIKAEEVITTQKDAVKIPAAGKASSWKYLRIEERIVFGEDEYREALLRVMKKK
jgi:tetraacyldisaccharide 4'-kinase